MSMVEWLESLQSSNLSGECLRSPDDALVVWPEGNESSTGSF